MHSRWATIAAALVGTATLAATTPAAAIETSGAVKLIRAFADGNTYLDVEGAQCDRPDSTYDVPFIDATQKNAATLVSIGLAAHLASAPIRVFYAADCRISWLEIRR